MIIHPAKQGAPEWIAARIGLPTASNFDQIVTPGGKASTSAAKYLAQLAAEWFLGCSLDDIETPYMERGTQLEASAVAWYELATDSDTQEVGLCLLDDGSAGASPDRLVGEDGALEIKCQSPQVHMQYVLGGIGSKYRVQVQGQLWVTGRKWCDLCSFHPTLPRAKVRIERDDEFIASLEREVGKFVADLAAARERLAVDKSERDAVVAEVSANGDHGF